LARHGVEWFVLDDGFQHLELARDVDIVLLDATDPFGGGRTLPAGRLREPISALQRADVVLITRSVQSPAPAIEAMVRRFTRCPILYTNTRLESVLRLPQLVVEFPPADWTRARFFAFCGIGNPAAFFEDLRRWGIQVVGERSFADHHVYSVQEAVALEGLARSCGAEALLCTEKDVWNLRHVQFTGIPAYCCRITLDLPTEAFRNCVLEAIRRGRDGAAT
jgi:tetraacyldisaccharide 4'-kinase